MRRYRDAGGPRPLDEGRHQQLEADWLDRLAAEQVSVLPEVARTVRERAKIRGPSAELGQWCEGRERGQNAIVLIAHGAPPAAVGELVIGEPAQRGREAAAPRVGRRGHAGEPGRVIRDAADPGAAARLTQWIVQALARRCQGLTGRDRPRLRRHTPGKVW